MTQEIHKSMFLQYINIVNVALTKHRETVIYKPMLELARSIIGDKLISVKIYGEEEEDPVAHYTIRFNNVAFDVISNEEEEGELVWELKESYLRTVVDHASDYVDHPEKFEWEWLKSYLGLTE